MKWMKTQDSWYFPLGTLGLFSVLVYWRLRFQTYRSFSFFRPPPIALAPYRTELWIAGLKHALLLGGRSELRSIQAASSKNQWLSMACWRWHENAGLNWFFLWFSWYKILLSFYLVFYFQPLCCSNLALCLIDISSS